MVGEQAMTDDDDAVADLKWAMTRLATPGSACSAQSTIEKQLPRLLEHYSALARRATAAEARVEELEAGLYEAAKDLAEYASYAEIVGGISVNRPQIRKSCDAVFEQCHAYRARKLLEKAP